MKKSFLVLLCTFCLTAGFTINLFAGAENTINKKFSNIESIKCKFALGDIEISKSSDNQVYVNLTYTHNKNDFKPAMSVIGKKLILKENFFDNSNDKGYSLWKISVPKECKLEINTGTGDIIITNVEVKVKANTGTGTIKIYGSKGEFEMNTGTGNVKLSNGDGEFDLNTGTGHVNIADSKGEFKANSGTGSVKAENITILFEGDFNSGTGNVNVVSPRGEKFDLSLNSGTGNAVLDMDGQPINGYFEMRCNARSGKIIAPFKFDSEKEFGKDRQKRLEKSYTKGNTDKRFFISTGTGKAVVKK